MSMMDDADAEVGFHRDRHGSRRARPFRLARLHAPVRRDRGVHRDRGRALQERRRADHRARHDGDDLAARAGRLHRGELAGEPRRPPRVSQPAQYAALAGVVGAEAIIFVPLLTSPALTRRASSRARPLVTMIGFAGLTASPSPLARTSPFSGAPELGRHPRPGAIVAGAHLRLPAGHVLLASPWSASPVPRSSTTPRTSSPLSRGPLRRRRPRALRVGRADVLVRAAPLHGSSLANFRAAAVVSLLMEIRRPPLVAALALAAAVPAASAVLVEPGVTEAGEVTPRWSALLRERLPLAEHAPRRLAAPSPERARAGLAGAGRLAGGRLGAGTARARAPFPAGARPRGGVGRRRQPGGARRRRLHARRGHHRLRPGRTARGLRRRRAARERGAPRPLLPSRVHAHPPARMARRASVGDGHGARGGIARDLEGGSWQRLLAVPALARGGRCPFGRRRRGAGGAGAALRRAPRRTRLRDAGASGDPDRGPLARAVRPQVGRLAGAALWLSSETGEPEAARRALVEAGPAGVWGCRPAPASSTRGRPAGRRATILLAEPRHTAARDTKGPTMTTTSENKELMQRICAALATGDAAPLRAAMADDFCWTVMGATAWSGTYRGKEVVLRDLLAPLVAQFAGTRTRTWRTTSWPRATRWSSSAVGASSPGRARATPTAGSAASRTGSSSALPIPRHAPAGDGAHAARAGLAEPTAADHPIAAEILGLVEGAVRLAHESVRSVDRARKDSSRRRCSPSPSPGCCRSRSGAPPSVCGCGPRSRPPPRAPCGGGRR